MINIFNILVLFYVECPVLKIETILVKIMAIKPCKYIYLVYIHRLLSIFSNIADSTINNEIYRK